MLVNQAADDLAVLEDDRPARAHFEHRASAAPAGALGQPGPKKPA
jgi:hypothetical protein